MLAALSLCAATPPDAEKRIDELFRPVAGGKSPGAAVAVVRNSESGGGTPTPIIGRLSYW